MLPETLLIVLHDDGFIVWFGDKCKEFLYGPTPSQSGVEQAVMYTYHRL